MAVDIFLQISNGIDGEASDKDHKNHVDVLAWSVGVSQSGSMHMGGGGGAGKANFQDISITKWVDKASVKLIEACILGTHIDELKLTCYKAGGASRVPYLTIEMAQVLVTSVSGGGSGGEDRQTENVTFNYRDIHWTYVEQDDKGAKKGQVKYGRKIPDAEDWAK